MYCLAIGCETQTYPFQLWFWKCADMGFMPFFNIFISPLITFGGQVGMQAGILFFIIAPIRSYRDQSGFFLDRLVTLTSVLNAVHASRSQAWTTSVPIGGS